LLSSATNPEGGEQLIAQTKVGDTITTTHTSPLGRTSTYEKSLSTKVTTRPTTLFVVRTTNLEGNQKTSVYPDGTVRHVTMTPDPRFGMQAERVAKTETVLPSGLTSVVEYEYPAPSLNDPDNPLSVQTLVSLTKTASGTWVETWDAQSRTHTSVSPEGRTTVSTHNDKGRVITMEAPGRYPTWFTYDADGRIETTTAGASQTDPDARQTRSFYNTDGYVAEVVRPDGEAIRYGYRDAIGQLAYAELPDGRRVRYDHDDSHRLTALSPPGRPDHRFGYDALDRLVEEVAPLAFGNTSCTDDFGCPAGESCVAHTCATPCDSGADCGGDVCAAGVCADPAQVTWTE
jgi:YD repeat-containing protein